MSGDGTEAKSEGLQAIAAAADGRVLPWPRKAWPDPAVAAQEGASAGRYTRVPTLIGVWSFDFVSHSFAWVDDVFGSAGLDVLERPTLDSLLRERVHADDLQIALDAFFAALHEECPHRVQYRMHFPDGSEHHVLEQGRVVRDARGRARKLIATCHDITGCDAVAPMYLESALATLRSVEDGSLQGTLVQRGGIPLHVSSPLVRMLGHDGADTLLCAGRLRDLFSPVDAKPGHDCEAELLRGVRLECRHEVQARKADGTPFWGEALRRVVSWQGLRAVQTTVLDITERKLLAAQLEQARQMQAVGSLAGGLAHEFNNVLQIVMGQASVLRTAMEAMPELAAGAERIRDVSLRGSKLVRKLLAVGRKPELQLAPTDVHELIPEVYELVRPSGSKCLQFQFDPGEGVPPVRGDREAIEQILINLYVNARDAMPKGGTLRVRTHHTRFFETSLRSKPWAVPGRFVEIAVEDMGIGISSDAMQRIFEPFYSTKSKDNGSGMGLAVVQTLVQQQGGFIRVESEAGRGTAFRIYLPAAEGLADADADTAAAGRPRRPTVLLVESDDLVAQFIERALDDIDCELITVADGNHALEAMEELASRVSLVLLDTTLPDFRGDEAYRALRRRDPDVPVVFLTGSAPADETLDLVATEGQRMICKPFGLAQLVRTVEEAL